MWQSIIKRTYIRKLLHCREIHNDAKYYGEEVDSYFVIKHILLCEHQWERTSEINIICPGKIPKNDHEVEGKVEQSFHFAIEIHKSKVFVLIGWPVHIVITLGYQTYWALKTHPITNIQTEFKSCKNCKCMRMPCGCAQEYFKQ